MGNVDVPGFILCVLSLYTYSADCTMHKQGGSHANIFKNRAPRPGKVENL